MSPEQNLIAPEDLPFSLPEEPPHPYAYLSPSQNAVYQAAQDLAQLGWFVFPARADKKGSYKSKKYSGGRRWGATNDMNVVLHDWGDWPHAGLGVATGLESGFFVIDVDTMEGHGTDGIASFDALCEQHGPLPKTIEAKSPTGSRHYYFRYPENMEVSNSGGRIAKGVDVRGDGGMIMAPPTYRESKKGHYLWVNSPDECELADCPEWLLNLIAPTPRDTVKAPDGLVDTSPCLASHSTVTSSSYGRAALASELEKLQAAQSGSRNITLFKCSAALGQLVAGGVVSAEHAREELKSAAVSIGLEAGEIAATIKSGFAAGQKKPRGPNGQSIALPHEGPIPLVRRAPPGRPYPIENLGPLRSSVETVAASTQAPSALAASSALAVASLCVQGFADVETLNVSSTSPLSLFFMTSALSGERKTAAYKPFVAPVEQFEREEEKLRQEECSSRQIERDAWKGRREHLQKQLASKRSDTDFSQIKADLSALGSEPSELPTVDRIVTEPTFEALIQLLETGQPSIGIFTDEGAQFLGGHAMSSENQQKTLAGMNKLWSGDPIKRTRVRNNDGHVTLFGKRLATHLMVQPEILRSFMSRGLSEEIGFLPRFLSCEPESKVGMRLHQYSQVDMSPVQKFGKRVKDILGMPLPTEPGTMNLTPRTLKLSKAAHKLLVDFYNDVETQQKPNGKYENVSGYASKIAEQAARLSGVLTLWQDLEAMEVEAQEMENAIALADYYLSEAVRLGGEAEISEGTRKAETLKTWLIDKWPHDDIVLNEITNRGPKALRETRLAREAMTMLEQHNWVKPLEENTVVRDKKRKWSWRIVK